MTVQLALFDELVAQMGTGSDLRRAAPPGAVRLLKALVRHGLDEDDLQPAAGLVLLLEEEATERS